MMRRLNRWNFSSRARELSGSDAIVVSIPKSGRTWVRVFLCAYFCNRHGLEFSLEPERYGNAEIPRIIYSHDIFEQRTKANFWEGVRGKYLIPTRELRRAKIVLLARDPRDAFVSLYLQLTHRDPGTPAEVRQKSVTEVLRDERFGIRSIIEIMNRWLKGFSGRSNFIFIRYESLRAAPENNFRELLVFLSGREPDPVAFRVALDFSAFENMKKLEAAGAFESKILRAGDVRDPESFKVRRGKVGGYEEYLSVEDQQYAAEALQKLDPCFGYSIKAQS
jgi:hypothetical protein